MRMMRLIGSGVALALWAGAAHAGEAGRPLGVVELFTSQGCNACPPADEVLAELAARPDVVALAYHVDYWDYLGWPDTLSNPDNTARQYAYMRALKNRSVYTPQAIVNGGMHVNGANRAVLVSALERNGPLAVPLSVVHTGDSIVVEAAGVTRDIGEAHLVLVFFDGPHRVAIDRGENEGRTVTYWNAVSGVQTVGMWHGEPARYEFPMREISKKAGSAILLQLVDKDGAPGAILGAAMVRKPYNR